MVNLSVLVITLCTSFFTLKNPPFHSRKCLVYTAYNGAMGMNLENFQPLIYGKFWLVCNAMPGIPAQGIN